MADAPPTPRSGPEGLPMERRRSSSEWKKSTDPALAASSAATSPPAEALPCAATEVAPDASPDRRSSSAAASVDRRPSSAAASVVGAAADAAPSADAKSPVEGEQKPEEGAGGADGAPSPSPEGTTSAPAAGSPPATPPDPKQASSPAETQSPEKKEELINLQWDYNTPLPNFYFRPSLMDLCVPVMAKNFVKYPGFGGISAEERLRVVNEIPLDLPLKLAADAQGETGLKRDVEYDVIYSPELKSLIKKPS